MADTKSFLHTVSGDWGVSQGVRHCKVILVSGMSSSLDMISREFRTWASGKLLTTVCI